MEKSLGSPSVQIGVIDGPVDFDHPAFEESKIRTLTDLQRNVCKGSSSIACIHGTFIVGMLCAKRGSRAPAICPNCKILLRPIFEILGNQNIGTKYSPTSTPEELAEAIVEMVRAGAEDY